MKDGITLNRHISHGVIAFVAGCFVLAVLMRIPCLQTVFDAVKLYGFCAPAGLIVSIFNGGAFTMGQGEAVIQTSNLRIIMPPSCSGFLFYLILCASMAWTLEAARYWIPLAAYPAAVLVNAVRVFVVAQWERQISGSLPLPQAFQHMAVGMTVFLFFLFFAVFIMITIRIKGEPGYESKRT